MNILNKFISILFILFSVSCSHVQETEKIKIAAKELLNCEKECTKECLCKAAGNLCNNVKNITNQ